MAEEVERGHENDRVKGDLPISRQDLQQVALLFFDALLEEGRRLIDAHTYEKHEDRRRNAEQKHVAPTQAVIEQTKGNRRDEIAAGIPGLQKTGDDTARARRDGLKGQRGTYAPLASHGDAEQEAQRQETPERRSES